MKLEEVQAHMDKFNARVDELDAKLDSLSASDRAEFEAERDDIKGQLAAWADKGEAEWSVFIAKLEQIYHDLEAKWYARSNDT